MAGWLAGWRSLQVQHLERFNLRGSAAGLLLLAGEEAAAAAARPRTQLEQTRSVYLQNTFEPLAFYRLPTVDPRTWVHVLEA